MVLIYLLIVVKFFCIKNKLFLLVIFIVFFSLIVRLLANSHYVVRGPSMCPTLKSGTHVIINRFVFGLKPGLIGVGHDEIIVFKAPRDGQTLLIKRVIGLVGDEVKVYKTKTTVRKKFNFEYNNIGVNSSINLAVYNLDSNEVFVIGDNNEASIDSRHFGPINREAIIGKVIYVFKI